MWELYRSRAPCLDSFQPNLIGALSRCSQLWRTFSQSLKNTSNNFDKSMKQLRKLSRCSQLWRSHVSHILSQLVFSEPGENQLCNKKWSIDYCGCTQTLSDRNGSRLLDFAYWADFPLVWEWLSMIDDISSGRRRWWRWKLWYQIHLAEKPSPAPGR